VIRELSRKLRCRRAEVYLISQSLQASDERTGQGLGSQAVEVIPTQITVGLIIFQQPVPTARDAIPQSSSTSSDIHSSRGLRPGPPNEPVCAPRAKVTLYGDTGVFSTVTDQDGKFAFSNIDLPGVYFIEAAYSGLHAEQNVMVHAGAVVQVLLHLEAPDPSV